MEEKRQYTDKFMLRLPDGMRDRIKLSADINGRSMNAEIVSSLEEKYPRLSDDPKLERLKKLMVKYLYDNAGFTNEEEAELNTLILTVRMSNTDK